MVTTKWSQCHVNLCFQAVSVHTQVLQKSPQFVFELIPKKLVIM